MKYISSAAPFLRRYWSLTPIAALILTLISAAPQSRVQPVSAEDKASAQLQAAAAANSESELQRVENSFPGTREAALARLLRGYLRFQAKDYSTATTLLT